MKNENPIERHVAENISEAIWLRLRRLTSARLCRKLLSFRRPKLAPTEIESKATGMAWAIKSALGYWDTNEGGLNQNGIGGLSAEAVSDPSKENGRFWLQTGR